MRVGPRRAPAEGQTSASGRKAPRPTRRRGRSPRSDCIGATKGEASRTRAQAPSGAEARVETNSEAAAGAAAPAADSGEVRQGRDGAPGEARRGQPKRGQSRPRFEGQRDRREDGARDRSNDSERRAERGDHAPAGKKPFEKKSFERPPDPNSPFAKLLALKATLEEKSRQDR